MPRSFPKARQKPSALSLTAIGSVALLVILAVLYVFNLLPFLPRDSAQSTPTTPGGTEAPSGESTGNPSREGAASAMLYFDGWSKAAMGGATVSYAADLEGAKSSDLKLSPMDEEEIKELATENPQLVTSLATRLVNTDKDFTCDAEGCKSSSGSVSYAQLANPEEIPGLGDMYEAYGVDAGLWSASMNVDSEASSVNLTSTGWSTTPLTLISSTDLNIEYENGDVEETELIPTPENGYLKGQYPLSYAFGKIFTTTPSWLGDEGVSQIRRAALNTDYSLEELQVSLEEVPFSKGLSHPETLANGLSASQLTYMSSPTTGCGTGVLCVPAEVENAVSDTSVEVIKVCDAEGQNALMGFTNSTWKFTLENPTSINGAWEGQSPEDFATDGSSVVYTGVPPLVTGEQTLRVNTVRLFDGTNGQLNLFATGGAVGQFGFDSDEATTRTLDADDVSNVFNGEYSPC